MDVAGWVWITTLVGLTLLLLLDLVIIGRRPHEPSTRECAAWVSFYIVLAALFGVGVALIRGAGYGGQFFAGWLTEYSLSVDNLFVFVIIMAQFRVPRPYQQKVLMVGIVMALLLRGAFIAIGAVAIQRFEWIFYVFGAFLVYTAVKLMRHGESDAGDVKDNVVVRLSRRILPVTQSYGDGRLTTRVRERRMLTPLLIVMIAIGTTDLIFALDSIPAIFGLTQEPYLVFTANVFALMGLRQLYFLLGNLLSRLVYLSLGLALILGFIGVKLIMEALHGNNLPFVNGGEGLHGVPEISIGWSLLVIIGTLAVTTVASLVKSGRDARRSARDRELERVGQAD
jgi:tellurite resistance protein TerC